MINTKAIEDSQISAKSLPGITVWRPAGTDFAHFSEILSESTAPGNRYIVMKQAVNIVNILSLAGKKDTRTRNQNSSINPD